MLLFLLSHSDKVEDRWQDEHSCALCKASDDTEDQSEVINEDGTQGDDQQVGEDHS